MKGIREDKIKTAKKIAIFIVLLAIPVWTPIDLFFVNAISALANIVLFLCGIIYLGSKIAWILDNEDISWEEWLTK